MCICIRYCKKDRDILELIIILNRGELVMCCCYCTFDSDAAYAVGMLAVGICCAVTVIANAVYEDAARMLLL